MRLPSVKSLVARGGGEENILSVAETTSFVHQIPPFALRTDTIILSYGGIIPYYHVKARHGKVEVIVLSTVCHRQRGRR